MQQVIETNVRLRDIADLTGADKAGFAGSPTIRIDGRDLEGYHGPARMAGRRYLDNDGHGWPGQELLREKLRAAPLHHTTQRALHVVVIGGSLLAGAGASHRIGHQEHSDPHGVLLA